MKISNTVLYHYKNGCWFIPSQYDHKSGRKFDRRHFEEMLNDLSLLKDHPGGIVTIRQIEHYLKQM
jgi:DNA invertase Pin-like site-specific DNA recombinase